MWPKGFVIGKIIVKYKNNINKFRWNVGDSFVAINGNGLFCGEKRGFRRRKSWENGGNSSLFNLNLWMHEDICHQTYLPLTVYWHCKFEYEFRRDKA